MNLRGSRNKCLNSPMKVRFSNVNKIHRYNYIKYPKFYTNVRYNKKIRGIERYMRKIWLLKEDEYLDVVHTPCTKKICQKINIIAKSNNMVVKHQYLTIVS